ncbi:arginase family protein [Candidatus Nomurabacteria bacterium]|nr:arginase family protein [Candidatus Nomurabacteria bacterium]
MNNLLLIKAKSRLGMKFLPFGGDTVLNIGVENGPDAVLDEHFLGNLKDKYNLKILDFSFSNPEDVLDEDYYSVFSKETKDLSEKILSELNFNNYKFVVTLGGDHSVALASDIASLKFLENKKVGFIDFDSHGDIHLSKTSPSGNVHGMWLRPLLSDFDEENIIQVANVRIPTDNFLYIGNLILEDEEKRFINEKNIKIISSNDINSNSSEIISYINDFCSRMDVLHVTFDIDVFKKDLVSATGTPNVNGFSAEMVNICMQPIMASKKLFSIDLVEVNPEKDKPEMTIKIAQDIILQFLVGVDK